MTDPGLGTQDIERHMAPATSAHNKPLSRDTLTQCPEFNIISNFTSFMMSL